MSMIDYHRRILADARRNQAFVKALERVIIPGKTTVADIGSGTGFLAFAARRLGAKECYLYEYGDVLHLSRTIAKQNGIDGCHFVHRHSRDVRNPPKVDVVISETLGNFALEEHILETLLDAKRFLKPGGILLPQRITQYACPVIALRLYDELDPWINIHPQLDFSAARSMCLQNIYVRTIHAEDLLEHGRAVQQWDDVTLGVSSESVRKGKCAWTLSKKMTIYGIALWWEAELIPGISLPTSPLSKPTHWEQIFLPFLQPVTCAAQENLEFSITSDTSIEAPFNVQWQVRAVDARGRKGEVMTMDMRRGYIA